MKTVRNLSQVYKKLNKSTEAEILLTRVLKSSELTKGMENMETIRIVSSIAILLKKQGKLNESEIMYKRALEGYEDSMGINSKDTLSTYNNLGILYKAKNEFELAKDMYDKALAGRLLLLGALCITSFFQIPFYCCSFSSIFPCIFQYFFLLEIWEG